MSRKNSKKKNSDILRLKILLEDKEIAKEELDIGTQELSQILQEYSRDISADQKKKYNNFFFGSGMPSNKKDKNSSISTDIVNVNASIETKENKKSSNHEHEPWVKKLYRKIVQRSHPDKFIGFPISEIKEKYKRIYMNAIDALAQNDIGLLLLCAYEVELKVEEPSAKKYIEISTVSYQSEIKSILKLVGYQWYHIPDINRIYFLENYLKSLGFTFNKDKATSVIKNNRIKKRRVGTRPEKILVKRNKKK